MSAPKVIALIPLRGGSKRIPRKNIKLVAGKPLAYWVCTAAINSRYISETYVSTEDDEIASVVESFHYGIRVIARPSQLATDSSTTEAVMLHFMTLVDFDVLATIQATSPLLESIDLDLGVEQLLRQGHDSLLSGVLLRRFLWSTDGRPLNYNPCDRPFTQHFKGSVMENGAFYLTRRHTLETHRNRLGGNVGVYLMAPETACEIDADEDVDLVERYLVKRQISRPSGGCRQKSKLTTTRHPRVLTGSGSDSGLPYDVPVKC